jgi:hypothetical protein
MRRGLIVVALAALCALAVPAAATAQCGPPKGVYVANAEFSNAFYLFAGQAGDGNLAGAGGFVSETVAYPLKVLKAFATEPPQCSAHRAPARRTRRASGARRR